MARKSKKDEELSEHSEDGTPMEETIKEEEGEEEEQQQGEDEEMEEAGEEEEELILNDDKLEILTGPHPDPTAVTFVFKDEDHTLGNSLRHIINKNPEVDFCGYSIPHPSEAKMHLRVQTTEETTAVDALRKGFDDLRDMCDHIARTYEKVFAEKDYILEDTEVV
ncbi:hypothetical protein VTP01DRAFT_6282 [Rhizomucor pusillus]|uniref:uncharacterized protein n=1 Tax=Rhizomucor pusillus TaxID=4840 RepID=UPI00374471EA